MKKVQRTIPIGTSLTEVFGELSIFQWSVGFWNMSIFTNGQRFEYGNRNSPVFSGEDARASAGSMWCGSLRPRSTDAGENKLRLLG